MHVFTMIYECINCYFLDFIFVIKHIIVKVWDTYAMDSKIRVYAYKLSFDDHE